MADLAALFGIKTISVGLNFHIRRLRRQNFLELDRHFILLTINVANKAKSSARQLDSHPGQEPALAARSSCHAP